MPCLMCNDLQGQNGHFVKRAGEMRTANRHHVRQDVAWSAMQASAAAGCETCDIVVRGCRGCLQQHGKAEGQIASCDISFVFEPTDDEDAEEDEDEAGEEAGDVDKHIIFRFQDGSWFTVQMFADPDDKYPVPDSWESVPAYNRTSPRTDSEAALTRAKEWIETCRSGAHKRCKTPKDAPSPPPLPTRVVDVQTEEDPAVVKVVESGTGAADDYVCLSHCWGSAQVVMTTRANRAQHLTCGLAVAKLPQTFQDAVQLTRRLGFRYLWIDSLCIVQDDEADWAAEAAQMAQVYSRAVVTLAATQATNSTKGLYVDTPTFTVTGRSAESGRPYAVFFRERIDHHLENVERSSDKYDTFMSTWRATRERHPLLTRAWVFQERLLSTRVLHFGPYELFFECRTEVQCECGGIGFMGSSEETPEAVMKLLYADAMAHHRLRMRMASKDGSEFWVRHWMARVWRTLVSSYTTLGITKPHDRLPAIGGLARDMARRRSPDDDYLAGLWRHTLLDDLVWRVTSSAVIVDTLRPRPRTDNPPHSLSAPTWSWASVGWHTLYLDEVMSWHPYVWIILGRVRLARHLARVEDCRVVLRGVDAFGVVAGGSLTLSGAVAEGLLSRDTTGASKHLNYSVVFPGGAPGFPIYPDYLLDAPGPDQVLPGTPVVCLRMGVYPGGSLDMLVSLVLRQKAGSDRFERIAILYIYRDSTPESSLEDADIDCGIYTNATTRTVVIE